MNLIIRQVDKLLWKKVFLTFLSVWLVIFFITAIYMIPTSLNNEDGETAERLSRVLLEIEVLRKQNKELLEQFRDIYVGELKSHSTTNEVIEQFKMRLAKTNRTVTTNQDVDYVSPRKVPTMQYELYRRRIATNVKEFWNYIHTELTNLQNNLKFVAPGLINTINLVINLAAENKRLLLHDLQTLAEVDGYVTWREKGPNDWRK